MKSDNEQQFENITDKEKKNYNLEVEIIQKKCNPFSEPFSCPLIIYIGLTIVSLILIVVTTFRARQSNGEEYTKKELIISSIVGVSIHLLVSFIFGYWLYSLCSRCKEGLAWFIFILSMFFPILLLILVVVLLLGVILADNN